MWSRSTSKTYSDSAGRRLPVVVPDFRRRHEGCGLDRPFVEHRVEEEGGTHHHLA